MTSVYIDETRGRCVCGDTDDDHDFPGRCTVCDCRQYEWDGEGER